MKKYPLELSEKQRRKIMRTLRLGAIFYWVWLIPLLAMGYMCSWLIWNSRPLAILGALAVLGIWLLGVFGSPHVRRMQLDTWRLLQEDLRSDDR